MSEAETAAEAIPPTAQNIRAVAHMALIDALPEYVGFSDRVRVSDAVVAAVEPMIRASERERATKCPTLCDADCEQPCHEVHQPTFKREHHPDGCVASIVAAVVADERERIRQLAVDVCAFYDAPCPDGDPECIHQDTPFAKLLEATS